MLRRPACLKSGENASVSAVSVFQFDSLFLSVFVSHYLSLNTKMCFSTTFIIKILNFEWFDIVK